MRTVPYANAKNFEAKGESPCQPWEVWDPVARPRVERVPRCEVPIMADSPTKRLRNRRKEQKRREKKSRRAENKAVEEDPEALAAKYLMIPEDEGQEGQEDGGEEAKKD